MQTLVFDAEGLGRLLGPAGRPGAELRDGWTLEAIVGQSAPQDRRATLVVTYAHQTGGKVTLYLNRRDDGHPAYRRTRSFNISYVGDATDASNSGVLLCDAFARALEALDVPGLVVVDGMPPAEPPANAPPPSRVSGVYAAYPDPVRRVGVIGGGTAGYLTALALRRRKPELEVTLVESSTIPIIGVGEATTPRMIRFLHETLEIDAREFYREVGPTWKLGIRFFWGLPGDYYFNYPFHCTRMLDAYAYGSGHDAQGLASMLMSENLAPVLRRNGGHESLLRATGYAYHLENRRLVRYLQGLAKRRGVQILDATVDRVVASPDKERVERLVTGDGRELEFDLYVDCTGFRSLLLEGALGSPFRSYASSLFNDTAVAAGVPHGGKVNPYTTAESMDSGWCWNIPHREENHRGYVFSSAFKSVDAATDEMRAKNPGMHDPWVIKFRSGRHEHWWKGNVVAMGNAYAFVEPLESTALHALIQQIDRLIEAFPPRKSWTGTPGLLNQRIGAQWDSLRAFLATHFKFNRKFDTEYWRASRADVDLAAAQSLVDAFREAAPLDWRPDASLLRAVMGDEELFGLTGYDNILLGQKVPTTLLGTTTPELEWRKWIEIEAPELVRRALPHVEALAAYEELLDRRQA